MKKKLFLLCWCGILTAISGLGDTATFAEEDSQITILNVRGHDVRDFGKTLESALSEDDVQIQVDPETNILMLKGSRKAVDKAAQLLKVLDPDPAPTTVTVDMEISIKDPDEGKNLLDRFQLSTLDNNSASLQFGQQVAVVTGRQSFGSRGVQVQTQHMDTGTLVKVSPRVASGGVVMELNLEKSWLEYPANDPKDTDTAAETQTPTVYSLVLETTLRLEAGKSQTIKGKVSGGASVRDAEITVSARTGAAAARSSTARDAADRDATSSKVGGGSSRSFQGSSDAASRGGSGGGGGPSSRRSGGRSGFPASSADASRVKQIATVLFKRMDSDEDGKIDSGERNRNSRMLESMGLKSSDDVTIETLMKAIQSRTSRTSRSSRPAPAESNDADAERKDVGDAQ